MVIHVPHLMMSAPPHRPLVVIWIHWELGGHMRRNCFAADKTSVSVITRCNRPRMNVVRLQTALFRLYNTVFRAAAVCTNKELDAQLQWKCFSDIICNAIGVARHNTSIICFLRLHVIQSPVPRHLAAAIWNDWELDAQTQYKCFSDNIDNAIVVARHNMSFAC